MKGDLSIPPLRDLPPNRLAQRREHLLSEIAQPPARSSLPRRRLLALVAAALIVVIGAASAIGGVRAFFLDRGFIGVPPEGATPSTPESGDLVLDFYGYSQAHGGAAARVWVYADGRVIWDRRRTDQNTSLPPPRAEPSIPSTRHSLDTRPRRAGIPQGPFGRILTRGRFSERRAG